jgi:uncharacterized protein (TIGR02722 family)
MLRSLIFLMMAGVVLVSGCTSTTTRMEVGRELVSDPTSVAVQDFQTIAQKMTRSMIALPQIQNASSPPTISFLTVENRSNDFVDKKSFLEKIRTLLIRNSGGKMTFLDRKHYDAIRKEQAEKRAGQLTTSGDGTVAGADYFLTGVISSINRAGGSEKTIYRRYAFRLTDAKTGVIIWEDEYETQMYHKRGSIYR